MTVSAVRFFGVIFGVTIGMFFAYDKFGEILLGESPEQSSTFPVEFTVWNEPAVVKFAESDVSFDAFVKTLSGDKDQYSLAEVRQLLFTYLDKKFAVYGRTPPDGSFSIDWDHISQTLLNKTIKQMLIEEYSAQDFAKPISLSEIKSLFFDVTNASQSSSQLKQPQAQSQATNVLLHFNSLVVQMQTYVLETIKRETQAGSMAAKVFQPNLPSYHNTESLFSAMNPSEGSTEPSVVDYCHIHFKDCSIEIRAYYLFKQIYEGSQVQSQEYVQDHHDFTIVNI